MQKPYIHVEDNIEKAKINGKLDDILKVQAGIPEFTRPYSKQEYVKRLSQLKPKQYSLRLAYTRKPKKAVGFLVAYFSDKTGLPCVKKPSNLYLWMGGVLPAHRRKGIMRGLFFLTEMFACAAGCKSISAKVFSEFTGMRALLRSDYFIEKEENMLEKKLIKDYILYMMHSDFGEVAINSIDRLFDLG